MRLLAKCDDISNGDHSLVLTFARPTERDDARRAIADYLGPRFGDLFDGRAPTPYPYRSDDATPAGIDGDALYVPERRVTP